MGYKIYSHRMYQNKRIFKVKNFKILSKYITELDSSQKLRLYSI